VRLSLSASSFLENLSFAKSSLIESSGESGKWEAPYVDFISNAKKDVSFCDLPPEK